jgi:hypothetical protein
MKIHDEVKRKVHTEHHEIALGEIDDAHHPKDDAKPNAHQAVDCP